MAKRTDKIKAMFGNTEPNEHLKYAGLFRGRDASGWQEGVSSTGSVVVVVSAEGSVKHEPRTCMCELCFAYRVYDSTLVLSKGDRILADRAFEDARKDWKERYAISTEVREGGTADGAGEGAQQVDEPVDQGRDPPSGGDRA